MLPGPLRRFLLKDTDPSVRHQTLRDLLDRPTSDPARESARRQIGRDGWAARILEQQQRGGHWETFRGRGEDLYVPKYIATNWRLIVLADLGLTRRDPRIHRSSELLMGSWSRRGFDALGGQGSEVCITGNFARTMTRFGYLEEKHVQRSFEWLVDAQKLDGGWHCFPSKTGTLDGWEAMAAFAAVPPPKRPAAMQRAIERGAEFYLERRLLRGSDGSRYAPWERIHYPNHYYYDFLLGLDILTGLGFGEDRRLRPALDLLERKRREDGTWALERQHPDLEPEEPYHPRTPLYPFVLEHVDLPSRWATLIALRVLRRAGRL